MLVHAGESLLAQDNDRDDLFAVIVVGQANHGAFRDGGVFEDARPRRPRE